MEKPEHLGQTLRNIRELARLSMMDVAKALGVSPVFVSDFERGRRNVPIGGKFETVLDALGVADGEREELRRRSLAERKSVALDFTGEDFRDRLAVELALRWDKLDGETCRGIGAMLLSRDE